ncbi:hypothetical protein M9434_006395 [Picochlorum sp. BPE23]|nr:hypothetical protein M9434_006395 [Picochlorum sp. BPE23]
MSMLVQRSARSVRLLLGRDISKCQTSTAGRIVYSSESTDGSRRVVPGLNVLKNGKDPEELKDEDVPEWLWKLADEGNGKSLVEMQRKVARMMEEGEEHRDVVEMMRETKYLNKLQNRSKIRARNTLKAKK